MAPNEPFGQLKKLALPLILLSAISNLAVLVSPIFMMQVLDRVVPSGNLSTLALLLLVAIGALIAQAFVEFIRDITFHRTSLWVETAGAPSALAQEGDARQDQINQIGALAGFFRSSLATTSLNIPWIPLFLGATALIHPYFLFLIIGVTFASQAIKMTAGFFLRDATQTKNTLVSEEQKTLQRAVTLPKQAGAVAVGENLTRQFFELQARRQAFEDQQTLTEAGQKSALTLVRAVTQIFALSLGAYLVVQNQLSAGGMIAASILVTKATTMIETVFGSLNELRESLQNFRVLQKSSQHQDMSSVDVLDLSGTLTCDGLIFPRGGGAPPRLDRVSFQMGAGQCLAIIGASGSGKTTLLNAMAGIDPCPIGAVTLDESDIRSLSAEAFKQQIGFVPQQASLLQGSLAQNISSFEPSPDDEAIVNAAKVAGVHGLISALPQAYNTDIGASPFLLSAGQKQRVALARAVYYQPKYLFLDEPNALLDADGERQLCNSLAKIKEGGTTIVMILHRAGIIGLADLVLRLENGRVADFGERAEVLARFNSGKQKLEIPLTANALQDLSDWVFNQFARNSDEAFKQKALLVATELFNLACQGGDETEIRPAVFQFRFIDEKRCEMTLIEPTETMFDQKLGKISQTIQHPDLDMLELEPDEMALAILAQLTDTLSIENVQNSGVYAVQLSSDRPATAQARTH